MSQLSVSSCGILVLVGRNLLYRDNPSGSISTLCRTGDELAILLVLAFANIVFNERTVAEYQRMLENAKVPIDDCMAVTKKEIPKEVVRETMDLSENEGETLGPEEVAYGKGGNVYVEVYAQTPGVQEKHKKLAQSNRRLRDLLSILSSCSMFVSAGFSISVNENGNFHKAKNSVHLISALCWGIFKTMENFLYYPEMRSLPIYTPKVLGLIAFIWKPNSFRTFLLECAVVWVMCNFHYLNLRLYQGKTRAYLFEEEKRIDFHGYGSVTDTEKMVEIEKFFCNLLLKPGNFVGYVINAFQFSKFFGKAVTKHQEKKVGAVGTLGVPTNPFTKKVIFKAITKYQEKIVAAVGTLAVCTIATLCFEPILRAAHSNVKRRLSLMFPIKHSYT